MHTVPTCGTGHEFGTELDLHLFKREKWIYLFATRSFPVTYGQAHGWSLPHMYIIATDVISCSYYKEGKRKTYIIPVKNSSMNINEVCHCT